MTAEFAMALPVLIAVVLGMLWLFSLGLSQFRIEQAASETARSAARGDADPSAMARRMAPKDADVTVSKDQGIVSVTVSVAVPPPIGLLSFVPAPTVSATSVAVVE